MDGPAFEAGLKAFVLWQSVITNAPLQKRGLLFGYELETLRRLYFNPFTLQVDTTTCLMEGSRNMGKSATLKILFTLLMSLEINELDSEGNLEYFRARSFSRKSSKATTEDGSVYHPEFELLAEAMKQKMFVLGQGTGLNLLSIFNKETDIIEFVLAAIEMELERTPGPDVTNVIMVGVNKMVQEVQPTQVSLGVLNNKLSELSFADQETYHVNYRAQVAETFELDNADLKKEVKVVKATEVQQVRPEHIRASSEARFYQAIDLAMTCIHQILEGDYGGAFNGYVDVYDVLARRVGHIDLEALPPKGQALFEMALLRAQSNAIIASKQDIGGGRNLLKTIPHYNAGDEEGIAIKSPAHLRSLALWMIRQRSFPTADFRTIQFGSQLLQAGDAGSAMRGLALEIEQGFGYRMIFGQPRQKKTLDRYRELNLAEPYVQLIPDLKPGQMILLPKDNEPVVSRIIVPPSLRSVIKTDAARHITDKVDRGKEAAEMRERFATLRPHGTLLKKKA
ncbi:MAG: hypothetical protein JWN28_610 [Candidatus Saccharibacteria bacterium]|nr:hypothetical protein [Candidatus Saccharibacteria bacterium]